MIHIALEASEGYCARGLSEGYCVRGLFEEYCARGLSEGYCARGLSEAYCARLVSNRKYAQVSKACQSTQFDDFRSFAEKGREGGEICGVGNFGIDI